MAGGGCLVAQSCPTLLRGRCGGRPAAVTAQGTEDATLVLMILPTLVLMVIAFRKVKGTL